MERVLFNCIKLIILLILVLIATTGPVYARISETTSGQRVHSMKATEPAKGRDRVNQVVLNTKEGGILQDQLVDTEKKKEACIRKGYPCEPYAKCCNSCVVDPIYGFFKCS